MMKLNSKGDKMRNVSYVGTNKIGEIGEESFGEWLRAVGWL